MEASSEVRIRAENSLATSECEAHQHTAGDPGKCTPAEALAGAAQPSGAALPYLDRVQTLAVPAVPEASRLS